jgi:hypothetical protein
MPTRMGTAGGFLRFGGAGGERRWAFFVPLAVDLAVDVLLTALLAGLGGTRSSKERTDTGESCGCAGGTARAPPGDKGDAGSQSNVPNELWRTGGETSREHGECG